MIPLSDDAGRRRKFPFVMLIVLATNILVFAYQVWLGPEANDFVYEFGLIPYRLSHPMNYGGWEAFAIGYVSLFTAAFLHGGLLHLAGNMIYLWVFGDNIEDRLGHMGFLLFYLAAGVAGNLAHTIVLSASRIPTIGASGAVAGLLGAYLLLFPSTKIRSLVFLGPFITIARLPAILLIGFWALLQFAAGLSTINPLGMRDTEVAYWAHIGGFLAGMVLVKIFSPRRR